MADLDKQVPEYHNVLCVGTGMTAIALGCQLKMMLGETDIRFFERESGIGGTWYSNTYPGAGCDIPVPLYSFSFAQKTDWNSFFASQGDIHAYQVEVADRFDLSRRCHFNTEVVKAEWDSQLNLWHVYTRPATGSLEGGGATKHWVCKIFVTAIGGLSLPNPCLIPGKETFEGPLFHSARWDKSADLKDKNVVVVGNGCTAAQLIPIVAKEAKTLTQFVRSKHWYAKRPANPLNFAVWRWMCRNLPFIAYLQRIVIACVLESHAIMMERSWLGTLVRNHFAENCRKHIFNTAPKKYHDALIPKGDELLPGCKRRVFDTDYLASLRRDNVDMETSALVQIKPKSVVTKAGKELPADVIIMCNGFNVTEMGAPIKIHGEGGITMQEYWKSVGGPQSYRTCMLSKFPNCFLLMSTNAGTGHFSYIHTAEMNARFAIQVMAPILAAPRPTVLTASKGDLKLKGDSVVATRNPSVQVKFDAEEEEQIYIQKTCKQMVYGSGCKGWYTDPTSGRVIAVYPTYQFVYAWRANNPLLHKHFIWKNLPGGAKTPHVSLPRRLWSNWFGAVPSATPQDRVTFRKGGFRAVEPREKESMPPSDNVNGPVPS